MDRFLQLIDNLFTMIGLVGQIAFASAEDVYRWLRNRGQAELAFVQWFLIGLVGLPALIVCGGELIGFIGYHADWNALIIFGRGLICAGAVLFALGALYLFGRLAVIAEVIVITSELVSKVPIPRLEFPEGWMHRHDGQTDMFTNGLLPRLDWTHPDLALSRAYQEKFLRGIMGMMFWAAFFGLIMGFFPVYASISSFLILVLIALALGFATYYWKLDTPWMKRISLASIVFMLAMTLVNLGQFMIRTKAIEADLRMQRIYADEYERISMEREDMLAIGGINAEDTQAYKAKSKELDRVRAKMIPATPGEIWSWTTAELSLAYDWTSERVTDLRDSWGKDEDDKFVADPATMGTPAPEPLVDAETATAQSTPPKAVPKISDSDKAKLQAYLDKMEADKKKRAELRKKLEAIDL